VALIGSRRAARQDCEVVPELSGLGTAAHLRIPFRPPGPTVYTTVIGGRETTYSNYLTAMYIVAHKSVILPLPVPVIVSIRMDCGAVEPKLAACNLGA
jgi:hypothetical protein